MTDETDLNKIDAEYILESLSRKGQTIKLTLSITKNKATSPVTLWRTVELTAQEVLDVLRSRSW